MPTPTRTADRISARFGHGGETWTDADGERLTDVLDEEGGTTRNLRDGGAVTIFADGSAIVTLDTGWDVAREIDAEVDHLGSEVRRWQSDGAPDVVYR